MEIYVGTYAKYNNGSIEGAWLDVEDYADKDEFLAACQQLHGEGEHEFMFQDWDEVPSRYISESSVDAELWTEYMPLDEAERRVCKAYWENVDDTAEASKALEGYSGTFDSEADWAADFIEQCGYLSEMPEALQCYIDYEAYARDARLGGDMTFVRDEGEVIAFRNY